MSFNSRIILNFFCTFLVLKLQNRQKDLGSNGHLSKFGLIRVLEIILDFDPEILSFKTRKVKDYLWVETHSNSVFEQINVTNKGRFSPANSSISGIKSVLVSIISLGLAFLSLRSRPFNLRTQAWILLFNFLSSHIKVFESGLSLKSKTRF